MQRLAVVGICLLIALAASALSATGALAVQSEPYFKVVSGASLPLNVEIEGGKSTLYVPALSIQVECESVSGVAKINDEVSGGQKIGILEEGELKMKNCVVNSPNCTINAGGNIDDGGVKAKFGYTPGAANSSNVRFNVTSGNVGGTFTTVVISGASCAVIGSYQVKKGAIASVPKADINVSLTSFEYLLHVNGSMLQELTEIENPAISSGVIKDELGFGGNPVGAEVTSRPQEPIVKLTAAEVTAGDKVEISLT